MNEFFSYVVLGSVYVLFMTYILARVVSFAVFRSKAEFLKHLQLGEGNGT